MLDYTPWTEVLSWIRFSDSLSKIFVEGTALKNVTACIDNLYTCVFPGFKNL